jgi:transposase-like protein
VVRSSVLTPDEEALCVAFRKHTLLDDCLYSLKATIPHLSRSALHRCFQRHGISRLPQIKEEGQQKKKFKAYPIGYLHIDIAEVSTAEGKLYMYVAIDRTSKFAYVELLERATRSTAKACLEKVLEVFPYKIHTILTDNGIPFVNRKTDRFPIPTPFERICLREGIEHRTTKVTSPWTNRQVERMNRTIKEATVKLYHYDDHQELEQHLQTFMGAYNFGKRLKPLKGLTPYEYICQQWEKTPHVFKQNPHQNNTGLYT